MSKKQKIYLDYAATTPMAPEVVKAMLPYMTKRFGNASSLHSFGQEAMSAVMAAREQAARFLGCETNEIIFTSGATEADNLAIKGVVMALNKKSVPSASSLRTESFGTRSGPSVHVITSAIEHPAILEPCRELEREGVTVTYVRPGKDGVIRVADIKKAIQQNTVLVSIMYVNNEVGTIQPIREIGEMLKNPSTHSLSAPSLGASKIYFHTDAVQALNYCDCRVDNLGVDLLSLSGHKIYGPKGIGALYVRAGTPLQPLQVGGHQEGGVRSGTVPVPLIVGLGKAIEEIWSGKVRSTKYEVQDTRYKILDTRYRIQDTRYKIRNDANVRIKKLRDLLVKEVQKKIPRVYVAGSLSKRVVGNVNFIFKGAEGESVLLMLDQEGIAVSTGSACASGSLEPSHVLMAMGVRKEDAHGSIRVTLGKYTTGEEIKKMIAVLPGIIKKLRDMSPLS